MKVTLIDKIILLVLGFEHVGFGLLGLFSPLVAAGFVGLVMGGIQSVSRSTYAKFIPETKDSASYFSYYDVAEKLGIIVGMLSYGIIEQLTGSMRSSIVMLTSFFILALFLLLRVPKEEVNHLHIS